MNALVLAAGEGQRLRPLTDDKPKPMIEIGGKPVLAHNVDMLIAAGVDQIIINLHYRPQAIVDHFSDGAGRGARIHFAREERLLGTAGAARNVAHLLGEEPFLVVYGDNLSTIDLKKLIATHESHDAALTMALFHREDTQASGVAEIDTTGRVVRLREKPAPGETTSKLVNAGYYVVEPLVLSAIPPDAPSDFARDVIPRLIADGERVWGYVMTEQLWWIDSIADYERTRLQFER